MCNRQTPNYYEGYLEDFSENIARAFHIVSTSNCDTIQTLDKFLGSSVFQQIHHRSNPRYLNMSSEQLLECLSFDDKFDWTSTKPTKEIFDPYIMEWVGTILTYFQWAYSVDFTDWLKYFSVQDIYDAYYPLHEASYETSIEKLKEFYDIKKLSDTNLFT